MCVSRPDRAKRLGYRTGGDGQQTPASLTVIPAKAGIPHRHSSESWHPSPSFQRKLESRAFRPCAIGSKAEVAGFQLALE